jgi:hypothetical protein
VARIVDLRRHCRRRLDRLQCELEGGLDEEWRVRSNGRAIREPVEMAMYQHVEEVLELWREDVRRAREGP